MGNYNLAVIKGDGIGPEIVNEAMKVLDKIGEKFGHKFSFTEVLAGGCAIDATGTCLPESTVEACKNSDSVILGAVGGPKWDNVAGDQRPERALLGLREKLGLFANLRPAIIHSALSDASPIKKEIVGDSLDILIVRELTGGIYFGERGWREGKYGKEAYDTEAYSEMEIRRIAKTAFEGGLHGRQLSTTSPEYGTDGSFAKCWIREGGTIKMLKRGSSGARNAGLEPYSEYYASQLVGRFTDHFVSYGLRTHEKRICSVCEIFTSEDYGFLPYAAVDRGNSLLETVLEKMGELGLEEETKRMFVIDAVILNEDRHKNNFGFIVNNDTQVIEGMAPLFDHNISLLPYGEEEDFEKIDSYLREKGPRLGNDWVPVASACLTKETRKALIDLKDFQFERHPRYNLPEWRLEALEGLIHRNIERILEF